MYGNGKTRLVCNELRFSRILVSCPRNKHIFRCDQNGPPVRTGVAIQLPRKTSLQVTKTHWSQVQKLWEDSDFILYREVPPGRSESLLVLAPASERPSPATIRQLEYLHSLRAKLD